MTAKSQEVHLRMPWGTLATKTWNSKELPPVLIVHGAKHNAGSFDGLIPLLSRNFFYVCVDLPGHGYSTGFTPGIPLSFMQYISTLQRLIRFFNWSNFGLIGHSFGAHLVLILAAAERLKVSFLILLDGTTRSFITDESYLVRCTTELEELLKEETTFYSRPLFTTYDAAVKRLENTIFPITKKAAEDILERALVKTDQGKNYPQIAPLTSLAGFYISQMDARTCFKTMAHMNESTIFYNCKSIICPILVVYPEQSLMHQIHHESEFHRAVLNILMKSHDLSRLKYINGDHCVHCNNPPVVASVINEFLSDVNDKSPKLQAKMYWLALLTLHGAYTKSIEDHLPTLLSLALFKLGRIKKHRSHSKSPNVRQCAILLI